MNEISVNIASRALEAPLPMILNSTGSTPVTGGFRTTRRMKIGELFVILALKADGPEPSAWVQRGHYPKVAQRRVVGYAGLLLSGSGP